MKPVNLVLVLCLFLLIFQNLEGQSHKTFSISAGLGIPLANKEDADLFSEGVLLPSFKGAFIFGTDIEIKSVNNSTYGFLARFNKYYGSGTNDTTNRFANSSLITFDIGPAFYYRFEKISSSKSTVRLMIAPYLSYLHLKTENKITNYNALIYNDIDTTDVVYTNTTKTLNLNQFLFGIMAAFDWSVFVNEKEKLYFRPGLAYLITHPDGYTEKWDLMASITIGYTFNSSRDKWFFLKDNKNR
jgi:hypothetical protein